MKLVAELADASMRNGYIVSVSKEEIKMELKTEEKQAIIEVAQKWSDPEFLIKRIFKCHLDELTITPVEDLFLELDFTSEKRLKELGGFLKEILRKARKKAKAAALSSLEESFSEITLKRW